MQSQQFNDMSLDGVRISGQEVRNQNVTAALAIANVIKSSLGPVGLDKMLVDQVGEVIITNDGATILKRLDVEHPAGKILVELAEMQDREVGDGTTSVVILATELLKRGNELIKKGLHPTTVISGYRLALKESIRYLKQNLTITNVDSSCLLNAARTSMSSKIIGPDSEYFAKMCVDAMTNVKTANGIYPVSAVNVIKAHGASIRDSQLVNGYAVVGSRCSQQMPSTIFNAKIALLDFNLTRQKLKLGISITIKDPEQLAKMQQRESDIMRERIENIIKCGANVILTSKGIDDGAMKYFVQANCIAMRRVSPEDLRRIAKATGAIVAVSLANEDDGGESFDPKWLGTAEQVSEERIGDGEVVFIKGCSKLAAQTIVLRGANEYMLNEVERSLHDSLCVVKRVLESSTLVAGGGAVEVGLSIRLEQFALSDKLTNPREQMPVVEFANALLVIPKTLTVNAAKDATELVAKLRALHTKSQLEQCTEEEDALKFSGLDLINGVVRDNFQAGVLEPALSKVKAMRFATEAAVTILRIDDSIKMNPSNKPGQNQHE